MAGKDSDKPRGPPPGDLPKPEKLPAAFQKIIDKADNEDNFYDELYDGTYVLQKFSLRPAVGCRLGII